MLRAVPRMTRLIASILIFSADGADLMADDWVEGFGAQSKGGAGEIFHQSVARRSATSGRVEQID